MSIDKPTPSLYREVFEDDRRGAAILEALVRRFASGAVLPSATVPGIDAVLQTYHRQGANSVVQHILNQINQAHQAHTPGEDDDPDAQIPPAQ